MMAIYPKSDFQDERTIEIRWLPSELRNMLPELTMNWVGFNPWILEKPEWTLKQKWRVIYRIPLYLPLGMQIGLLLSAYILNVHADAWRAITPDMHLDLKHEHGHWGIRLHSNKGTFHHPLPWLKLSEDTPREQVALSCLRIAIVRRRDFRNKAERGADPDFLRNGNRGNRFHQSTP